MNEALESGNNLDPEINAEIEECERLESLARTEKALSEMRERADLAYDEWARVATHEGVPHTYKQGA